MGNKFKHTLYIQKCTHIQFIVMSNFSTQTVLRENRLIIYTCTEAVWTVQMLSGALA